jgi:hypothetical protein
MNSENMGLQRYLRHKHLYEALLVLATAAINAFANVGVTLIEFQRQGRSIEAWEPITWEVSSMIVILMLFPAILAFDRRRPMQWGNLRTTIPRHVLGSVLFCVTHVSAMVFIRTLVYAANEVEYVFGDVPVELLYEYLKDVRSYFAILLSVYAYRFILLRLQGEASVLSAPDVGTALESVERPQRFLVRKLGKEFLVAASDVEWLEAQGNYINLHVRDRVYPLRSTMVALEALLDPAKFVRVHRSHIVNLEYLSEIEPLDSGDARLKLRNGKAVPCSRTFRAALRERSGAPRESSQVAARQA